MSVLKKIKEQTNISMIDSVLSEDQAKYFANSRVRDERGNLLRVYHGTKERFEMFDPALIGRRNGAGNGAGFNFTDNREIAQHYASMSSKNGGYVFECYLNIEKPLSSDEVTLTNDDVERIFYGVCNKIEENIKEIFDGEVQLQVFEDLLSSIREKGSGAMHTDVQVLDEIEEAVIELVYNTPEVSDELGNTLYEDYIDANIERLTEEYGNEIDLGEFFSEQLINAFISDGIEEVSGHDGFIGTLFGGGDVYVALRPEQIKDCNNLHPTKSPLLTEGAERMDAEVLYGVSEYNHGEDIDNPPKRKMNNSIDIEH